MHYLKIEEIQRLNIDINSACNAACPGCARQIGGIYRNDSYSMNQHMSLETWTKLFNEIGHQIKSVVFCGNYGDAGATNHLPEMLAAAHEINPNTYFIVVSNIGLNSVEYWKRLGNCVPKHCLQVQCSIDGLEDTNHLYRRFVKWDKVMRNVRALSETGALMIWKYIEFEWNKHQIDQARALAQEFNFHDFIVTPNNQPGSDRVFTEFRNELGSGWDSVETYMKGAPFKLTPWQELDADESYATIMNTVTDYDTIECYTKNEQSIHVDWNGNVWPCCWFGGTEYLPQPEVRSAQSLFVPDISSGWNNINNYSLQEIMDHSFYQKDLMNSLDTKPSTVCASSCGKCNGQFNAVNTIGKQS
jgi:MoaA/NifB/PqqE/SkfB family radical SAM enzyme